MAKISPVSAKYIIHATIYIEGIVDRPDVIGAIFGQTEGLLGEDLELRELQRSGRIGRIEVGTETKQGKTHGTIIIPSSLDKAETAIVGAALEIIQRIGPCNSKIKVEKIEDVRISKRKYVIERAKDLLRDLTGSVLPDSQELADEVAQSVRVMEICEYGADRLPAGPAIEESDEILIVEGRADVINLLKHGFKNAIAMNGTSVPETIKTLAARKTIVAFVDGDRGGDLILKELLEVADIDFVTKAPDGKEVEEITKKEIHKALRSKIAGEQAKLDLSTKKPSHVTLGDRRPQRDNRNMNRPMPRSVPPLPQRPAPQARPMPTEVKRTIVMTDEEKGKFREMLEDLIGTRGAYILDDKLNILGKVPTTELISTVKSLSTGIHAIVFDGNVDKDLVGVAEKSNVKFLIAMDSKVSGNFKSRILTADDLE
ncbi:hypothetical protein COV93_08365 [Candidatus Woesearchaeota archaeon CG11_big_fil_rev_8_21_14_0_20_43_8]|nr:MAG: hypothetical protein COV93_08365 [Candidatus Woesearchaeota archaeon CG11_big_fil_rev_8_21_14_0_20_43_8]PIO04935.1 MAG: hypothetical protein COT47_06905 [Candidatus Woesearchaeota archaeon CG08_land_8_20_14_0_20_43_7]